MSYTRESCMKIFAMLIILHETWNRITNFLAFTHRNNHDFDIFAKCSGNSLK